MRFDIGTLTKRNKSNEPERNIVFESPPYQRSSLLLVVFRENDKNMKNKEVVKRLMPLCLLFVKEEGSNKNYNVYGQ